MEKIKGVILDYGGTIDTNGQHWAGVFFRHYNKVGIQIDKDLFTAAYVHAERSLALKPLIKTNFTFKDTLIVKLNIQLKYLQDAGALQLSDSNREYLAVQMAESCNDFVVETIASAQPVLQYLYKKYPLVMVSNFYGNISTVLKEYQIDHYFKAIIESSVVGFRKPDPQIFQLGLNALNFSGKDVLVLGDSYTKDIKPAKSLFCKTLWLNVSGWNDSEKNLSYESADHTITNFTSLMNFI